LLKHVEKWGVEKRKNKKYGPLAITKSHNLFKIYAGDNGKS
jgi:hypothetical protein